MDYSFVKVDPDACPDFSNFQAAATWAHDEMLSTTDKLNWNPSKKNKAYKDMKKKIEKSRRMLVKRIKKNPKCIKDWNDYVSLEMVQKLNIVRM